jgi:hypothetical protein
MTQNATFVGDILESNRVAFERRVSWIRYGWILLAVGLLAYVIDTSFRSYSRLTVQLATLGGVTLGDSRGEVRYKRGDPPVVYAEPQSGEAVVHGYFTDPNKDPANALPEGTDADSFPTWAYFSNATLNPRFDVTFDAKTGRVTRIDCVDQSDPPTSYCDRVAGVGVWDVEARITSLLGAPTRQSIEEKSGVKTMDYGDIGLVFLLKRQRVFGIYLYGSQSRRPIPMNRFKLWLADTVTMWWQA